MSGEAWFSAPQKTWLKRQTKPPLASHASENPSRKRVGVLRDKALSRRGKRCVNCLEKTKRELDLPKGRLAALFYQSSFSSYEPIRGEDI